MYILYFLDVTGKLFINYSGEETHAACFLIKNPPTSMMPRTRRGMLRERKTTTSTIITCPTQPALVVIRRQLQDTLAGDFSVQTFKLVWPKAPI